MRHICFTSVSYHNLLKDSICLFCTEHIREILHKSNWTEGRVRDQCFSTRLHPLTLSPLVFMHHGGCCFLIGVSYSFFWVIIFQELENSIRTFSSIRRRLLGWSSSWQEQEQVCAASKNIICGWTQEGFEVWTGWYPSYLSWTCKFFVIVCLIRGYCTCIDSKAGKVTTNAHSQGIRFLTEVTGIRLL